jgi:hypothetical protein
LFDVDVEKLNVVLSSSKQAQVDEDDDSNDINVEECDGADNKCYDVAITQINYPSLNKQDSIEQVRGQSNEEILVQIFILYDVHLGGDCKVIYGYSKQKDTINVKSKKIEIYQEKETSVVSKHPLIEIRTDHRN